MLGGLFEVDTVIGIWALIYRSFGYVCQRFWDFGSEIWDFLKMGVS